MNLDLTRSVKGREDKTTLNDTFMARSMMMIGTIQSLIHYDQMLPSHTKKKNGI